MNDLYHYFGGDLSVSPTGDLAPVDGTVLGQQRILRRLLTNPGDYIWQPDFGAGLPQYVGRVLDEPQLRALILGQMRLEAAVSKSVDPTVTVGEIPGGITVAIQYVDADTQSIQFLSFDVTA